MNTPRLGIPMLAAAQAQKHVTHNQALQKLDALVQLSVLSRTTTAPPSSLNEGDAYIVATGATGNWVGHDNEIAVVDGGQWSFVVPGPGWIAYVIDEDLPYRFLAAWAQLPLSETAGRLGVNATPDNTNRLSVSAAATLLNHEGAGHQVKVNKAMATDTASLLFQTDWSGRAEMGTAGGDDFEIKVSPDGSNWTSALTVSASDARLGGAGVSSLLLGTVSMENGVPTGSVVERGTNSDGTYVRFSDGTQVCVCSVNLGSIITAGAGTWTDPYRTNSASVTWPAQFASPPSASINGMPSTGASPLASRHLVFSGLKPPTAEDWSYLRFARMGGSNADFDVIATVIAVGHWV